MLLITRFIDILHIMLVFLPFWLLFLSKKYFDRKTLMKFLAIYIAIPLHWYLLDNQCIVTYFTKKMGGHNDTKTKSSFSEKYLRWYYEPFIRFFGHTWNDKSISYAAHITAIINISIVWYLLWTRL
jgi:hypothetical protein